LNLVAGIVVADRFRLERPLGQGGMGAVWLAQHMGLDVPCAVKFIHAESAASPEIRARFEREAKSAAQLRSPNVVQILDHGIWEGAPYIAMEYLEGEDLAARLRTRGRLDARETAAVASQVARALARAHAAGLVHRDLKPANIFLVRDDDREIAKVLDFGVAKSAAMAMGVSDSKTKTGALLGTPYYMSPEQAQGTKVVDHRSDLWALGVVVYQCITGQLPFQSEALGDLFMKIIVQPLPVPSHVAPVPPGFDAWWARCSARDPDQRFQSAKELADALALSLGLTGNTAGDFALTAPYHGPQGPSPQPMMRPQTDPYGRAPPGPYGPPTPNAGSWPSAANAPNALNTPGVSSAPSWPNAGAMPQTAGPVVAALVPAQPTRGAMSPLPFVAAALLVMVLGAGAAIFVLRPASSSPVAPAAELANSVAAPPASPSAPANPPATAAPGPPAAATAKAAASAAPPITSASVAVKSTPTRPTPVQTSKPEIKTAPPKKPDFGI
jgi:serine/threonine-protein kinase